MSPEKAGTASMLKLSTGSVRNLCASLSQPLFKESPANKG